MPVSEHLAAVTVKGYREFLRKLRHQKSDESSSAFQEARERVSLYVRAKKARKKGLDPQGALRRLWKKALDAKHVCPTQRMLSSGRVLLFLCRRDRGLLGLGCELDFSAYTISVAEGFLTCMIFLAHHFASRCTKFQECMYVHLSCVVAGRFRGRGWLDACACRGSVGCMRWSTPHHYIFWW